jgi:hypothetical protein
MVEEVEGEDDGLLAFPLAKGEELGAGLEIVLFGGGRLAMGAGSAGRGLAAHGFFKGAPASFRMKEFEQTQEEGIGAEAPADGFGSVAPFDDAAHGFAFEEVAEGLDEFGLALGEGGVGMALADDDGERLAGGLGGAGFLVMGGKLGEIDGDPIGGAWGGRGTGSGRNRAVGSRAERLGVRSCCGYIHRSVIR